MTQQDRDLVESALCDLQRARNAMDDAAGKLRMLGFNRARVVTVKAYEACGEAMEATRKEADRRSRE